MPRKAFSLSVSEGVGKTVLLDRIWLEAESQGFFTLRIEAPEG